MHRFLLLFTCILISLPSIGRVHYIRIKTQAEFDMLETKIEYANNAGFNKIVVVLAPGTYSYKEAHLKLRNVTPALSLYIKGNGSVLRGEGQIKINSLRPEYSYYKDNKLYNPWGKCVQSTTLAEVVNKHERICRIKMIDGVEVSPGDIIQISQWYLSPQYVVSYVKDSYIYFVAEDLNYLDSYKGWNINLDYYYGKEMPRYRIYNTQNKGCYESKVMCFMGLDSIRINKISLSGIHFEGSAYSLWNGQIRLNDIRANQVLISNCKFTGSHSMCINVSNSENVTIQNCLFENNYNYCIREYQDCENVTIRNNFFNDNGLGWTNLFNIRCEGNNFLIADNIFKDFGYGAVGVGVWYAAEKVEGSRVSGVIENNEIYYSPSYFANYRQHSLMDGGAIYTFTKNDGLTIRYNYIHDFVGMKDNRGVFCDDGTCNVKIYGNIITNTPNCYSIDLREVAEVEIDPRYDFGKANVGNEIYGNIVDGCVRFEGRKDDSENGCLKGANYLLASGGKLPTSKISSIQETGEDVVVNCLSTKGKVILDKESFKLFKKHPHYKQLKHWVKKGRTS